MHSAIYQCKQKNLATKFKIFFSPTLDASVVHTRLMQQSCVKLILFYTGMVHPYLLQKVGTTKILVWDK